MTGAGPSIWARRILTLITAMLLLTMGATAAYADPQPGPTQLTVQARTGADFGVEASGTLTDQAGEPIPDAPLQARINGEPISDASTGEDGTYTLAFTLPEALRSGAQELVVFFADHNGFETSQAATTITAQGPPAAPPAPPTPEDTRLDVLLDVSIAPAVVSAGDLVTIEGTITDESKAPISGARLTVLIGDKESKDSLVVSDDAGTFQTFAEMPPGTPPGTTDLVVSFAGDDSYTPGLKRFDVTVDDLPMGDEPTSTSDPAATSSEADPSATARASGSPAQDTVTKNPSTDATVGPGPLSWFYIALIVVGGVAVLIAAALVFRGLYSNKPPTRLEDPDLDSLLRPDDASDTEEGALLSDTFIEDDPQEPPAPRP